MKYPEFPNQVLFTNDVIITAYKIRKTNDHHPTIITYPHLVHPCPPPLLHSRTSLHYLQNQLHMSSFSPYPKIINYFGNPPPIRELMTSFMNNRVRLLIWTASKTIYPAELNKDIVFSLLNRWIYSEYVRLF